LQKGSKVRLEREVNICQASLHLRGNFTQYKVMGRNVNIYYEPPKTTLFTATIVSRKMDYV
jgi:hypothetical protein